MNEGTKKKRDKRGRHVITMNRTSCYTHTWLKDYLPTLPLDISTPFFLSFFLSNSFGLLHVYITNACKGRDEQTKLNNMSLMT